MNKFVMCLVAAAMPFAAFADDVKIDYGTAFALQKAGGFEYDLPGMSVKLVDEKLGKRYFLIEAGDREQIVVVRQKAFFKADDAVNSEVYEIVVNEDATATVSKTSRNFDPAMFANVFNVSDEDVPAQYNQLTRYNVEELDFADFSISFINQKKAFNMGSVKVPAVSYFVVEDKADKKQVVEFAHTDVSTPVQFVVGVKRFYLDLAPKKDGKPIAGAFEVIIYDEEGFAKSKQQQ